MSFRVIEGGGEPVASPRRTDVPFYMVGVITVSWFACVGVAWTAYAVCRALGLVKP